jgi:hypothetical protein
MAPTKTGIVAHDSAVAKAEAIRQSAVQSAAGTGATLQANVRAAEVTFYSTVKASALANNVSPSAFTDALRNLGQTG